MKKLSSHTLVYGMGDVVVRAIAFLLIPLYARKLPPGGYGDYSLLQTVQLMAVVLAGLGLNSAFFKVFHERKTSEQRGDLVVTSLSFSVIWGLVFAAIVMALAPMLSTMIFHSATYTGLLRLIAVAVFFDLFRLLALALLRAQERPWHFAALNVTNFLLLFGLNIVAVGVLNLGLKGIVQSLAMTSALMAVAVAVVAFRRLRGRFSWPVLRSLLSFGLPLVPNALAVWALSMSAQFFVKTYCPAEAVDHYGVALRFGMVLNMVLARPFRTAWLPFLFSVKAEPRAPRIYSLSLTYFAAVGLFLLLGMTLLSREVVIVTATARFLPAATVIPLIGLAYLFFGVANTVDVGILLTGKTKVYATITLAAAAVQVGINLWAVPRWGLMGAAVTMTVSYFGLMVATYFAARRLHAIRYEGGRLLKLLLAAGFLAGAGSLLSMDSVFWTVAAKTALWLVFPLTLWALGFFTPQEKAALKRGLLRMRKSKEQ